MVLWNEKGADLVGGGGFDWVVGCWLLVVGCWLLVVGCWLLVVGCWLLVVGCWLLVVGCWLLVVGCWLLVVGCWLLVVGCWLLVGKAKGALQQETNQYQGGGMRYRRNYVDSKSSNRILFFHFTTQNHIPPAPPKRYKIFNGSLEKYSIIASILDSQFCA